MAERALTGTPSFALLLRHYRVAAGLTQEELAERAGMSTNAISALERGERKRPYPDTIRRLGGALNLSERELAALLAAARQGPVLVGLEPVPPPSPPPAIDEPLTALIGREQDIAQISAALTGQRLRLLTLTGPGGVGKTRLALAVLKAVAGSFSDGALAALLAGVDHPDRVPPVIGDAIGIKTGDGRTGWDIIEAALRDREALLLLDNLEHLPGLERPITRLLQACPHLTVLTTSRTPLAIRAEQEWAVRPLTVRDGDRNEPARSTPGPAVELFIERAQAIDPSFLPDPNDLETIAGICTRLDGLPLAIELAAARIRLLSPTALLSRLESGLGALGEGPRDLPERQRTMRAAIAWSYDLLTPAEQGVLRALSAFVGGADLEDAEAVCGPVLGDSDLVFDALSSLAAKQLIVRDRAADLPAPRIFLLETVRAFGLEQLELHGEAELTRTRHAERFLANAEVDGPALMGPRQRTLVKRFTRDAENLYAALGTLIERQRWNESIRLMWSLWRFWWMRGEFSGIGRRTATMLARHSEELQPLQRAQALIIAGSDIWAKGSDAELGLSVTREGVDLAVAHGDHRTAGIGALTAGILAIGMPGQGARATQLINEARHQFRLANQAWGDAMALGFQAVLSLDAGDLPLARARVLESIALARASGDQVTMHQANYTLGLISLSEGATDDAEQLFMEGLQLARDVGDITNAGYFLRGLSGAAALRSDARRAVLLAQTGQHLLETASAPRSRLYHVDQRLLARLDEQARATLTDAEFEETRAQARSMSIGQALTFAVGS